MFTFFYTLALECMEKCPDTMFFFCVASGILNFTGKQRDNMESHGHTSQGLQTAMKSSGLSGVNLTLLDPEQCEGINRGQE